MLQTLADFPHPGAIAWLRPEPGRDTAEKVRILEPDSGEGVLIAFAGLPPRDPALGRDRRPIHSKPASGNRRVAIDQLAPTRDEALKPAHPEEPAKRASRRAATQRKPRGKPRQAAA